MSTRPLVAGVPDASGQIRCRLQQPDICGDILQAGLAAGVGDLLPVPIEGGDVIWRLMIEHAVCSTSVRCAAGRTSIRDRRQLYL